MPLVGRAAAVAVTTRNNRKKRRQQRGQEFNNPLDEPVMEVWRCSLGRKEGVDAWDVRSVPAKRSRPYAIGCDIRGYGRAKDPAVGVRTWWDVRSVPAKPYAIGPDIKEHGRALNTNLIPVPPMGA